MASEELTPEEVVLLEAYYYTQSRTASELISLAESFQSGDAVTTGIDALDEHLLPLSAGQLMLVLGVTGQGKSTLLMSMALSEAEHIITEGKQDDEVVLFITLEESVGEKALPLAMRFINGFNIEDIARGRADLDVLKRATLKIPDLPMAFIGASAFAGGIPLGVQALYDTIIASQKRYNKRVRAVFMDYAQVLSPDSATKGYESTVEISAAVKRLGVALSTPMIVGVQANFRVLDRANKIPTSRDSNYFAELSRAADRILALWMPAKTNNPHEHPTIDIAGGTYENKPELMVIRIEKQRLAPAGNIVVCNIDFNSFKISAASEYAFSAPSEDIIPW